MGETRTVGYNGSNCCVEPDGYDNDWYQAIRLQYTGSATLSFDCLLDSETEFDGLQVETDSACASFARVDYDVDPKSMAAQYRHVEFTDDGLVLAGAVNGVALTNHGAGAHCVYVSFFSDGGISPCDGISPSTLGRALVVDNVELTDSHGTTSQDFEGEVDPGIFVELHDTTPFGQWGRLYSHITDNDACAENTTCAWLWTDYTTPTPANDPSMAFAPNGYVVRNWLDDMIVSPWVSLVGTANASGTVLRYRRFGANPHITSRLVGAWNVRGRQDVGGQECVSLWGGAGNFQQLTQFRWQTFHFDLTTRFDPGAAAIQLRHRVVDLAPHRLFVGIDAERVTFIAAIEIGNDRDRVAAHFLEQDRAIASALLRLDHQRDLIAGDLEIDDRQIVHLFELGDEIPYSHRFPLSIACCVLRAARRVRFPSRARA